MAISRRIAGYLTRSSWIRAMFERGRELKARFGVENVFDLSLGNPHLRPPVGFRKVLHELIDSDEPGIHGYMPNAGFRRTREAVAARLTRESGLEFGRKQIVMTVGAGGSRAGSRKTWSKLTRPGTRKRSGSSASNARSSASSGLAGPTAAAPTSTSRSESSTRKSMARLSPNPTPAVSPPCCLSAR